MKKIIILGIIALFIGLAFIPSFNAISINIDSNKKDESGDWNFGFILCRVCYMETWSWYKNGMPGQGIKCIDVDTGEIVSQGKTWIFGFFLFKFLPLGHDYKITADTEYGQMSKKINDLDFFQKVELLFIIGH